MNTLFLISAPAFSLNWSQCPSHPCYFSLESHDAGVYMLRATSIAKANVPKPKMLGAGPVTGAALSFSLAEKMPI